ncbi:MAG: hydroxylamine oxidase, partial [Pseudomonadota bacterium]
MWVYSFLGVMLFSCLFVSAQNVPAAEISQATKDCLECHNLASPGIVADWKKSRHYQVSPAEAVKKPVNERRVSVTKPPDNLAGFAVGCAECHANNPGGHPDSFEHGDLKVHVVVTPKDCQVCH